MSDPSWPVRLAFRKSAQELFVEFEDGASGVIPYKRLREESPSAEVRGHGLCWRIFPYSALIRSGGMRSASSFQMAMIPGSIPGNS